MKSHYVPKCYLKNFSLNGNILMKPKDNFDKITKTNISDVACKNGLYDIPEYVYRQK